MNEQTIRRFLHIVLYVFGFLILWEWIRPLETISDVGNSHYFVIFIVFMMIADYFSLRWLWKWPAALLYVAFVSYILYYGANPMFGPGWVIMLIGDFVRSIFAVIQLDWNDVTNSFRTFLFFILLWMMTYLLHYWLLIRKRILLFVFLSIAFVATLDTFTRYDGDWAIVRLFVLGVLLLGVLRLLRLIEKERVSVSLKAYSRWLLPSGSLALLAVAAGFIAPKPAAQWPDPVPFIISTSNKFVSNEATVKKVGYGEDDTRLGGDFIPDNTLVFRALVDSKHYWYVESKNVYTGAGWEVSDSSREINIMSGGLLMPAFDQEIELSEQQFDIISIVKSEKHIPYPNLMLNAVITPNEGVDTENLLLNLETGKLTIGLNEEQSMIGSYEVLYQKPIFRVEDLQSAGSDEIKLYYPESDYTQLPETLPTRIKELAESITKDEKNMYDKVKAVEDYFHSPDFAYSRTDVPVPDEDEDFVDQFLFESMKGYCDHFSTSMVVMLRTLDIPARWVKGYTAGTYVRHEEAYGNKAVYEVTNNNAHSWVEVYFAGLGWIPFEPTKGYDLNVNIESNTTATPTDEPLTPSNETQENKPQPERQETEAEKVTPDKPQQEQDTKFNEMVKSYMADHWKSYMIIITIVLLLIGIAYFLRGKWLPRLWIWRFSISKDQETFIGAYAALLKELNRCGIKRKSEQTLRDYAQEVDCHFSNGEMGELTMHYERIIYGNGNAKDTWEQVKPLWKKVMIKTIT